MCKTHPTKKFINDKLASASKTPGSGSIKIEVGINFDLVLSWCPDCLSQVLCARNEVGVLSCAVVRWDVVR